MLGFDRGSLSVAYRKPFDMLVEGNESGNWLGSRDSNPDNVVQSGSPISVGSLDPVLLRFSRPALWSASVRFAGLPCKMPHRVSGAPLLWLRSVTSRAKALSRPAAPCSKAGYLNVSITVSVPTRSCHRSLSSRPAVPGSIDHAALRRVVSVRMSDQSPAYRSATCFSSMTVAVASSQRALTF
jgi:hypothetical protein